MINNASRSLGLGSLVFGLAAAVTAQGSTEALQAKYDAKVQEAWYTDGGWTDDFSAAKAKASESGRPIFAYFTRSYSP